MKLAPKRHKPVPFSSTKSHIWKSCILLILLFFSTNSWSQDSSLADADYNDYKSSRYASARYSGLVKDGIEAFHAEKYEQAQKNLYEAFNKGCESPIVLFMLALLSEYNKSYYSSLDYYKMAKKNFQSANGNHRYSKNFNENYGRALYYSGKKDEAMPFLKRAGKRSKSYWLLKLLGMLSYEQGDTLNAVSYFERAVRIKDSDITQGELVYIYGLLAKLFLHKGERDGAQRYYLKVLELDSSNAEAQNFIRQIKKNYEQQKMMNMMEKLKDM